MTMDRVKPTLMPGGTAPLMEIRELGPVEWAYVFVCMLPIAFLFGIILVLWGG